MERTLRIRFEKNKWIHFQFLAKMHTVTFYIYITLQVCLGFPREKRENEEFADEEFLTRKTDEENEEFISLKYKLL